MPKKTMLMPLELELSDEEYEKIVGGVQLEAEEILRILGIKLNLEGGDPDRKD